MRSRIERHPRDPRHGTVNGYVNLTCRCQACRDAWAGDRRQRRERHYAQRHDGVSVLPVEHGTFSTYTNYGCRCPSCTEANRAGFAEWRSRA